MAKLRERLNALLHSLGIQHDLHAHAVRRMKARHAGQKKAERQRLAAEAVGDELRKNGHVEKAARKDRKALRLEAKATRERNRAIVWKGRVRVLAQRLEGIETNVAKVQAEIKASGATVSLKTNKATGGTFAERWQVSNLKAVECCSNGRRRNAYSQVGTPDIEHPYGPGPTAGRRDDCSSYTTSQALATGADDPNGCDFSGEGFTGTLLGAHGAWVEVSLDRMIAAGQGYIVYGEGTGHHVECYCPSETDRYRTVGHGSAPVDFGTVHLFGTGEVERYFIYQGAKA